VKGEELGQEILLGKRLGTREDARGTKVGTFETMEGLLKCIAGLAGGGRAFFLRKLATAKLKAS